MHQQLLFTTAEDVDARASTADDGMDSGQPEPAPHAVPKVTSKELTRTSATMEGVTKRLRDAFVKVASNRGAPGPDRQTIAQVRVHLDELLKKLTPALLDDEYRPGDIRRVYIEKAGGGERGLGIPNVVDRMVQEAVRQELEPLYEPSFHPSSHGFRPRRSSHTAITQAKGYLEDGRSWVVDLDLESFFDRVNHQRLMARLAQRVKDRRVLVLIGRMLKAKVVMPNGVMVSTEEGVPQGGPLSPLLSNIVLDELDWELERRGHRFVRYADDCNIYVASERAGQRAMASIRSYIERRLRLKVNEKKSAVARPKERHFLGFSLSDETPGGSVEVYLSERSRKRLAQKIQDLTPRNWGCSLKACITQINAYLKGWIGYFRICTGGHTLLSNMDAHLRRRLRAIQLKQWKSKRTRMRRLIRLGVAPKTAWRWVYAGHRSLWSLCHTPVVDRALRNAYFAGRGLVSLEELWKRCHPPIIAPRQLETPAG